MLAVAAAAGMVSLAHAHAVLKAAGPAPGSVVNASPKALRIQFNEAIELGFSGVDVTNEKGEERRLGPGDMAFFPAGSRSTWRVPVAVRKLAVCRQAMPLPFGFALRAWNKIARIMLAIFWPPEDAPADPLAPKVAPAPAASELGGVRSEA